MAIIEIKNMTKKYDERIIFQNFSLFIEEGEMVAIMGPSGSGKSTLLNILGLIEDFDEGEYKILGYRNVKINSKLSSSIIRDEIGYLFQNFALIDDLNVRENLMIALKYVHLSKENKNKRVSLALKKVGLDGLEDKKLICLSGGEQQRLAVARLLLKPSSIILADEPTGSVDQNNKQVIFQLLKWINKNGKTVIIVTHDKEIGYLCNRIICLEG